MQLQCMCNVNLTISWGQQVEIATLGYYLGILFSGAAAWVTTYAKYFV